MTPPAPTEHHPLDTFPDHPVPAADAPRHDDRRRLGRLWLAVSHAHEHHVPF